MATLSLGMLALACEDDQVSPGEPPPPTEHEYELVVAFPGLAFHKPVDVQHAGDGTDRLFVVEQRGVIKVFVNADSVSVAKTFLDVSSRVTSGGERGFLGLAFHPDYQINGFFFVYYTPNPGSTTRVSRFQVSAGDPDAADSRSETILINIPQDYVNHNGGQIAFGPDRYLYVAVGDEGGGGDPKDNAQNLESLHGSILRIEVDSQALGNYGIPPDNPFAVNTKNYRPEIYAYGLRNPWRFSFDPVTGRLWAGDVGQNAWEEIEIIERGGNYGWDCREGANEFDQNQRSALCDTVSGIIDPVWEYSQVNGDRSVTGGHVYRGPTVSSLIGVYIYADYISERIWGLHYDGAPATANVELVDADFRISAFGVDESGELYLCEHDPSGSAPADQQIYKLKQVVVSR
jgi:glucose/arabinose dehydrogenase